MSDLRFVGLYGVSPPTFRSVKEEDDGRLATLKLSTPSGKMRDVALDEADLVAIIRDAAAALTRKYR